MSLRESEVSESSRMTEGSVERTSSAPASAIGGLQVAVLVPCRDEAGAIGEVVTGFRRSLPQARIYVYDNNSGDDTVEEARRAGAVVRRERWQGKGYVVRRMFADVEADIYVMVDGDDTYDAGAAGRLIELLVRDGLDMVNAARADGGEGLHRPGHKLGNRLLSGLVRALFGAGFTDMLSGYRVFSRRFVKSLPMASSGFEIETELTVHALELQAPIAEVATVFRARAPGTASKLRTLSDGWRILWTILTLLKQERPLLGFFVLGGILLLAALVLAYPVLVTFVATGPVPRLPTAVLSTGLTILAVLGFVCGLVLEAVTKARQEAKRMAYLAVPGVHAALEAAEAEAQLPRKRTS